MYKVCGCIVTATSTVLFSYHAAVSHVSTNGPSIVSVGSNVTFSIQLLRNDEVNFCADFIIC